MNVRIEYPAQFLAAAYWDGSILMNSYTVRCEMITGTSDAVEQNIALERLKWILFHAMQNSVFVDAKEKTTIKRLEAAGLRAVTLPAPPVDQVIGMMLYSKLEAVMEGRISVTQLSLSSELGENVIYYQNNMESLGPLAQAGWWQNPEPVCSDSRSTAGKVVSIGAGQTWKSLDLHWSQDDTDAKSNVVAFRKDEDK
jgi:hypothetical protein